MLGGSNNPAMRLYKFETDTGQVCYHVCSLRNFQPTRSFLEIKDKAKLMKKGFFDALRLPESFRKPEELYS